MTQTPWAPDVLAGFEQSTLGGLPSPDGPLDCVLVRRRALVQTRRAVLYVHGYVDYFYQTHLADFYNNAGLHFYALDLRRHGRALTPDQLPNYTRDVDEFLQDLDCAVRVLRASEEVTWLLLNGHSTGGLVAALYAHRGAQYQVVNAVFLNSPFLDMNLPRWQQSLLEPLVALCGRWFPRLRLPGLSPVYGQCLHAEHRGQWHFNVVWKPIDGFPVFAGWFRAIHRAHAEVARGLDIRCPVLVLHAQHSTWPKQWSQEAMCTDTVLNVADMARLAPGLGTSVTVVAIPDGLHDVVLSAPEPQRRAFEAVQSWLDTLLGSERQALP